MYDNSTAVLLSCVWKLIEFDPRRSSMESFKLQNLCLVCSRLEAARRRARVDVLFATLVIVDEKYIWRRRDSIDFPLKVHGEPYNRQMAYIINVEIEVQNLAIL